MSEDFTPEQKRYLEGFVSGVKATRGAPGGASAPAEPTGPDAIHLKAQDETVRAGGKLNDQEKWKRAEHPFDAVPRLKDQAARDAYPKPDDNFRWRYHGLFYVAPAQDSYMCRLRIPNGVLKAHQFAGVADLAEAMGGGYAHVTTRANLQVREIPARHGPDFLEGLYDLGLTARGSGADNIRNVTGTPTAGIDPQELLDTRPHARAFHFHVLNDRSLYGMPRKFNVAFDGGGRVAALEDTNDIGFQAVEVLAGGGVEPGVYYRLALGGITGHRDLARDTGVVLRPEEAVGVADAVLRVFIRHGDRTDRKRSRLKYVLDSWGFPKFVAAVEEELKRPLLKVDAAYVAPRPPQDRLAHYGVHAQAQPGLNWVGVVLPVGRMSAAQMRGLARIARDLGDGDLRLTVWQNLLISGVKDAEVPVVAACLAGLGLTHEAGPLRAGLVACTGATGCKFGNAHTKEDAERTIAEVGDSVALDAPVNVHFTGCHNSCAQHYIGDIGLVGAKVPVNDDGDTEPGYDVVVGGGHGADGAIARDLVKGLPAREAPALIEGLLRGYLAGREGPGEPFHLYAARHDPAALLADARRLAPPASLGAAALGDAA